MAKLTIRQAANMERRSQAYARVDPGWRKGLARRNRLPKIRLKHVLTSRELGLRGLDALSLRAMMPAIDMSALHKAVATATDMSALHRAMPDVSAITRAANIFTDYTPPPELGKGISELMADIGAPALTTSTIALSPQEATREGQVEQREATRQNTDVMVRVLSIMGSMAEANEEQAEQAARRHRVNVKLGVSVLCVSVLALIVALVDVPALAGQIAALVQR